MTHIVADTLDEPSAKAAPASFEGLRRNHVHL